MRIKPLCWYLSAAIAVLASPAHAQSMSWGEEFARMVRGRELIAPLSDESFGDQVNLYDGTTTFSNTDVSIPGNDALPVEFSRSWNPQNHGLTQKVVGDWVIDVPNIGTLVVGTEGWALDRCSTAAAPPTITMSNPPNGMVLSPSHYWDGYRLDLNGSGGGLLLSKTTDPKLQLPTAARGATSPWTTRDGWYFSCLPTVQGGSGEGFVGYSPDGKKYTFNQMVVDQERKVAKRGYNPDFFYIIPRTRIRLYATRVEDRFGNWVNYEWSGDRLQRIYSKDGRQISLAYDAVTTRLSTVTANGQTWTYRYKPYAIAQIDKDYLSEVELPDKSRWIYNSDGFVRYIEYKKGTIDDLRDGGGYILSNGNSWCNFDRVIQGGGGKYVVTQPSGAQAEYTFTPMRHGRKSVPENCMDSTTLLGATNRQPLQHDTLTLTSKKITGTGLGVLQTNYAYAGLDPGYELSANPEDNSWLNATPAPNYKIVKVTEADGTETTHIFGRDYNLNEGRLFRVETRKGGVLYRTDAYDYVSDSEVASMPFPGTVGQSFAPNDNRLMSSALRPIKRTVLNQDGVDFTSSVTSFDAFARPWKTTRSSTLGYSRSETAEYHDNRDLWVVSLPKRNLVGSVVESEISYNSLAQPVWTKTFGKLQQTMTYAADGTLATVKDGNNNVTTLSGWKRGTPQLVQFPITPDQPTGASKSVVVNADGSLDSITDENGYTTTYDYDAMGRVAKIVYPQEVAGTSSYDDTTISFAPAAAQYGLGAGHWAQVVARGTYRKTTHFDAYWRPVLVEESGGVGTTRFTAQAYDLQGREAFKGYAQATAPTWNGSAWMNGSTAMKGTRSTYDALDRMTQTDQDSELGVLTARVQYLSGFKRRTTNPRLNVMTEEFQAFDQPSYDSPVLIRQAEGLPEESTTTIQRDIWGKPLGITRSGTGD